MLLYVGFAEILPTGISDPGASDRNFRLVPNHPNPSRDKSNFYISLPQKGEVHLVVTDLSGNRVITGSWHLEPGLHGYSFIPGNENVYLLSAQFNRTAQINKILVMDSGRDKECFILYEGKQAGPHALKIADARQKTLVSESGITDHPDVPKNYQFQFATGIPCPGNPAVPYEGQTYNTVQIFSQCWLRENLNAGIMIGANLNQTNNQVLEKYCYGNQPDSCVKYGGLYQWDELMQYCLQQGTQGICPPGWHVPSDEEWKVLEGAVDSQYGIGDTIWDDWGYRGSEAGLNLKMGTGWLNNGNGTNLYGFSGLPGGIRYSDGHFNMAGEMGFWWTSTTSAGDDSWRRSLHCDAHGAGREGTFKNYGFSVRCLKDEY
jgi:uncharacterized protein (TIGR02145 family)